MEHQLRRYIIYTCKKCGWQTAIVAQWADLKPKKCKNSKCGCFFLKEPNQLDIKVPKGLEKKEPAPSAQKKLTKKKTSRKKKAE